MKILLIEDNKTISENIKKYLNTENFVVDQSFDGAEWLEKAKKWNYDIIILDLMLPSLDGVSICKEYKRTNDTPIIMTTAKW